MNNKISGSASADLVIRNANIIDGTGTESISADVAICADTIVAIGKLSHWQAKETLDAKGKCLTPGFIDVHTHDDIAILKQPTCLPKLSQGVSTLIIGNCGISAVCASLSAAPPDPMNLLGAQSDFRFATFPAYVEAFRQASPSVNVGVLVGHTTLRNNVMDDLYRAASDDEIAAMIATLREAMAAGALGLSTGLAYQSAHSAPTEEVIALAKVVAEYDGLYTTHLRTEFDHVDQAIDEALLIGAQADVPVVVSHLKCAGVANWGRSDALLSQLEAGAKYQPISCDCYPYTASSTTLDLNQVTDEIDIFISWSEPHPELSGQLLADIASQLGVSQMDAAKRLQPAGAVYHCMSEKDVDTIVSSAISMIGSDGIPMDPHPHPRLWGTFPRVLSHFVREKGLLSLEHAVHKMTGLPASRFGLMRRGVIAEGHYADLVLFDADTIKDSATYAEPKQLAQGIEWVMVNGVVAYEAGKATEQRPGRVLIRDS
uniref:N-acyl-D-amino-acid deacylase family protein n=1 Tax=Thaumasiovibrio occultus TaxID=1891184 RepID=UPI000B362A5D|nr:D-aminoacylase [Thaumasiovibrio occultus]